MAVTKRKKARKRNCWARATESAKQVIDDTHQAAEQALSDATKGLIAPPQGKPDKPEQEDSKAESTSQET